MLRRYFAYLLFAGALLAPAPVPADGLATDGPATDKTDKPVASPGRGYLHPVIIPIVDDMISDVTRASLRRRIAEAREDKADLIIFEINTPGGLVTSALDICYDINDLSDIHTVAWVHPKALSAGSMIAVSCDEIVISMGGQMGDCAPIMVGPGGGVESMPDTVQSKIESPIKATFADAAQRRGYDPLLCEAMVTIGKEIYWIENAATGARKFVTAEEKARLFGERKSEGVLDNLAKRLGGVEAGTWKLVETFPDAKTGEPRDVQQPVVETNELLTVTANQAVAYGFARAVVGSVSELREEYGLPAGVDIPVLASDWSEHLTAWLTSPGLRGLLMVLLMVGAYVEFQTPGLGAGGAVALVALMLLLGAPYLTGLASSWEIGAVIVGMVLMAVELFVLPGFGVAGILGLLCVMAGLLGTFVPAEPGPFHWPQLGDTWTYLRTGVMTLTTATLVSLIGMWSITRYLPHVPVANQMMLGGDTAQGHDRADDAPVVADAPVWVGARGVTQTVLRPAGKALIDGQRFDVVTEGDMVEPEVEVQVVRVEGNRVVVRRVADPTV